MEEPLPRPMRRPVSAAPWSGSRLVELSRAIREPDVPFLAVLRGRRSTMGHGDLSERDLATLLWHATLLRERRPASDGSAAWESRAAPSAGGLHAVAILCLPLGGQIPSGIHVPERHALASLPGDGADALAANADSVSRMIGAVHGVTLQFVADMDRLSAAYENAASLAWRDAGVLLAIVALVAQALGLHATPLGRTGSAIAGLAGMGEPRWTSVGAVHLTGE